MRSKSWATAHSVLQFAAMEVLAVMIVMLLGAFVALPAWPYSSKWGYLPAGACGLVALGTALLVVVGRL